MNIPKKIDIDWAFAQASGGVFVYDADGIEIKDLVEADSETGECVRLVRDEADLFKVNPEQTEILRMTETRPTPFKVVPRNV